MNARGRARRRRASSSLLALAVLGAAAGPPVGAGAHILDRLTTSTGRVFAVAKPEVDVIPNFAEIEPGLSRGGRLTREGIEYLTSKGYRTVVTFLDDADERRALADAGIDCVSIPLHAGLFRAGVPTQEQVRRFLEVASDSARRPLYFHCKRGRDRTGAMAAIYRMERHGWTAAEAVQEMRAFGFNTLYKGLLRFVRGYRAAKGEPAP